MKSLLYICRARVVSSFFFYFSQTWTQTMVPAMTFSTVILQVAFESMWLRLWGESLLWDFKGTGRRLISAGPDLRAPSVG